MEFRQGCRPWPSDAIMRPLNKQMHDTSGVVGMVTKMTEVSVEVKMRLLEIVIMVLVILVIGVAT